MNPTPLMSRPVLSRSASGTPEPPATLRALLGAADISTDGKRPWDMRVNSPRLYRRMLSEWSLGVGESYMDGDWDCERLDQLFDRILRADIESRAVGLARLKLAASVVPYLLVNRQRREHAFAVGEQHYDIGNDLFERMLDSRMVYSCGYWEQASTLEQAQVHKLEMICRKLQLRPGMTVLDIGCGWGGLARHAAEHHGVKVTGITVSREQKGLAEERCAGLPVQVMLQDYRDLQGRFDRIVSVGMFEHVGPRNYSTYFETAHRLLEPEGLFLLHTIGLDRASARTDPWIDKYIFPGGKLPAVHEIAEGFEPWFVLEDWHNFGADYDRTLMAWHERFEATWPELRGKYGERFGRMWRYYLLSCAGFFRSRQGQLWQLVLTRRERKETYRSVRPYSRADEAYHAAGGPALDPRSQP
jgi:cyclopropane-fatty-acyl-phospholipid synthase